MRKHFLSIYLLTLWLNSLVCGQSTSENAAVIDASSLILNYDPQNPTDLEADQNGNSYSGRPLTSQALFTSDIQQWDWAGDGVTFETWFSWKGNTDYGFTQNQTLLYYGMDTQNYWWFSPCVSQRGSICPGMFKLVKNGQIQVSFTTPAVFMGNFWSHLAIVFHPTDPTVSQLVICTNVIDNTQITIPLNITWSPSDFNGTSTYCMGHVSDPLLVPAIPEGNPFGGKITEARIWNYALTPQEISTKRQVTVDVLVEPKLMQYLRFNEQLLSMTATDETPYGRDAMLLYNPSTQRGVQRFRLSDIYSQPHRPNTPAYYPKVKFVEREVSYNGSIELSYVPTQIQDYVPFYGKLFPETSYGSLICVGWGHTNQPNTCNSPDSIWTEQSTPAQPFQFTFFATRAACAATQSVQLGWTLGAVTSNPMTFDIKASGVNSTVISQQFTTASTAGGDILSISGANLGLSGPVDLQTESIVLVNQNISGAALLCTNGTVFNESTINCTIPAGVGIRDVQINICRQTITLKKAFSYPPPSIKSVTGDSFHTFVIEGDNFGPSRDFDNKTDYVHINTRLCIIQSVSHNVIHCLVQEGSFAPNSNNVLRMSIGNQTLDNYQFQFVCLNTVKPQLCQEPGLTPGMKGGIAVGVIAFVCIIVGLAYLVYRLRRRVTSLVDEVKVRKAREYEMMQDDSDDRWAQTRDIELEGPSE